MRCSLFCRVCCSVLKNNLWHHLSLASALSHSLAVCCSLSCNVLQGNLLHQLSLTSDALQGVLQGVLQCVGNQSMAPCLLGLKCVAVYVAVCFSVLHCVAVRCSLIFLSLSLSLSFTLPFFLMNAHTHSLSYTHSLSLTDTRTHTHSLLTHTHTHTHTFPLCLPPAKKNKQKMSWLSLFQIQRFFQCCVCDKEILYHTH